MKRAVDFLITQKCNYRCEYCSQSKKFSAGNLEDASDETIEAFLRFLSEAKEPVDVTISGGEPLTHPKFFYLVQEIVKLKHKLFVVSNFSYPIETYKKLKDIAGNNLAGLLISLHVEQIKDVDDFLNRARIFNEYKENTDFSVGAVLSDDNCLVLKKVAIQLKNSNIRFELQHMRINNGFVNYGREASDFIKDYPISRIKEKSFTFGHKCRAGLDFMLIYHNGDCYRCYSSRFNRIHSMGNIKNKGFKMYSSTLPCLNKNCTCPKPIILNMVDYNIRMPFKAMFLSFYNALWLPYYGIKNFKILKSKISQFVMFKKRG